MLNKHSKNTSTTHTNIIQYRQNTTKTYQTHSQTLNTYKQHNKNITKTHQTCTKT